MVIDSDSTPGLHRSGSVPGTRQPLQNLMHYRGHEPYEIAWFLRYNDVFKLEVNRVDLPLNQMRVGLRTSALEGEAFGVGWAKEIVAWNLIAKRTGFIHRPGHVRDLTTMTIQRAKTTANPSQQGTDTIVLRKPGFAGFWKDMYHFPISEFWDLWGGREVIFTWIKD